MTDPESDGGTSHDYLRISDGEDGARNRPNASCAAFSRSTIVAAARS